MRSWHFLFLILIGCTNSSPVANDVKSGSHEITAVKQSSSDSSHILPENVQLISVPPDSLFNLRQFKLSHGGSNSSPNG
ncbi:MAG: hypothetical protein AAFO69_05985, partial [Bacteroidota bacterium]